MQQRENNTRHFNAEPMVNKLSAMFRGATRPLGFGNPTLKSLQVAFMYFVDDIQRGPSYDAPKQSVFVLHWIQQVENAIKNQLGDDTLKNLSSVTYQHQNFFV